MTAARAKVPAAGISIVEPATVMRRKPGTTGPSATMRYAAAPSGHAVPAASAFAGASSRFVIHPAARIDVEARVG